MSTRVLLFLVSLACWHLRASLAQFRRGDVREFVACSPMEQNLSSVVALDLFAGNVTETEIGALSFGLQSTYNGLQDTCDPFFRTISEVSISFGTDAKTATATTIQPSGRALQFNPFATSNSTQPIKPRTFFFRVFFTCRGCPSDTNLFDDGIEGRRLSPSDEDPEDTLQNSRRLQQNLTLNDPQCVCSPSAEEFRAPSAGEFTAAYNDTVDGLKQRGALPNVAAVRGTITEGDGRCASHADCDSLSCAHDRWDSEADKVLVCCSRLYGETHVTGFGTYCDEIIPNGFACPDNSLCESRICIDGICRGERRITGELCDEDPDCQSKTCAYDRWLDEASKVKVCCPEQHAYSDVTGYGNYCNGIIEDGNPCPNENNLCASGVCFNNICQSSQAISGSACDDDSDCQTNTCAADRWGDEANKQSICCSNGFSHIEVTGFGTYCEEIIPTGSPCPQDPNSNSLCLSGICQDGVCAANEQATVRDGGSCEFNSECFNNKCVQGVCRSNFLQIGELCVEDLDCQTGICAYDRWGDEPNKQSVCCSSGSDFVADLGFYCNEIIATGNSCPENRLCADGPCIEGVCRDRLNANFQPCEEFGDCLSSECAFDRFNDDANKQKICCSEGSLHLGDLDEFYCQHIISDGESCPHDNLCESEVCIGGTCRSKRVSLGQTCDTDPDCVSLFCGYDRLFDETNRQQVCCDASLGYTYLTSDNNYYCNGVIADGQACIEGDDSLCKSRRCENGVCAQSITTGQPCNFDEDCPSFACAADRWNDEANKVNVCCEGYSAFDELGSYCEGIIPDGEACPYSVLCASGGCIDGQCVALKGPGSDCFAHEECQTDTCAFGVWGDEGNDQTVCCRELYESSWIPGFGDYCDQIVATGNACPTNNLCESGICIDGVCRDVRLPPGEVCGEDDDCQTLACALSEWPGGSNSDNVTICCSSEFAIDWVDGADYCHQIIETGSECPSNGVCKSGLCIDGVCKIERNPVGGTCEEGDDCVSLTCAADRWNDEANKVNACCPGIFSSIEVSSLGEYCYEIIDTGSPCPDTNELCKTGLCIGNVCVVVRNEAGQSCTEDDDCQSLRCAGGICV